MTEGARVCPHQHVEDAYFQDNNGNWYYFSVGGVGSYPQTQQESIDMRRALGLLREGDRHLVSDTVNPALGPADWKNYNAMLERGSHSVSRFILAVPKTRP